MSHTAAAHMNESDLFELVDTGNHRSNKEVDWQKVFYVFWKYKMDVCIHLILLID